MSLEKLTGLVIYSADVPAALAFYREQLGLPLAAASHGPIKQHHEALIGQTHVALWPGKPRLVPVFRVPSLAPALAACEARGARRSCDPIALGEGKTVVGLVGADGFEVRLIEIA
jgi:catechol 2,3-dioxygenase-like lactoylglutathione lyase family enzyme